MSMRSRQGLGLKPGLTISAAGVCVHRDLQPAAPSPLPLPHLLTQSCPGSSVTLPLLSNRCKANMFLYTCNQLGVSLRRLAAFLGAEELEEQNAISGGLEKIEVLDSLTV